MKKPIYEKIREHTIIMVCISAFVFSLIIALGFFVIRQSMLSINNSLGDSATEDAREILVSQSEVELKRLVENKASIIDRQLDEIVKNVERMAYAATVILEDTRFTEQEAMELLRSLILADVTQNDISGIGASYYGTEQGEFYGIDKAGVVPGNIDMRDRPWYVAAVDAGGLIWTDVYEDQEGRGLSITCAMPYYGPDGELAGVAGIGMTIGNMVETVVETRFGETGYAFLLDRNNKVNVAPTLTRDEDGNTVNDAVADKAAEVIESGTDDTEHIVVDGARKILAYHPLSTVPWNLVVIIDADEVVIPAEIIEAGISNLKQSAIDSVDDWILMIAAVAGGFIIIFILAGVFFSNRLARRLLLPIRKMTEDAVLIGDGALDHVLEVNTGDELETLAATFNSMIAGVKAVTAEKERAEMEINEKAREAEYMLDVNRNMQTILDTMPVAIRILSLDDWTLLYSNQSCLEIFGCTSFEEQVEGQSGLGFMPEYQPDGRTTAEHLDDALRDDTNVSEFECLKLSGEPFICRITSCKINYMGHHASLAAMEDVTKEREIQRKLQSALRAEQDANRAKSIFLANMSHEIRTPMNAILGITEIQLQKENLSKDTEEALETIYESGDLLLNIINDILDLSRIESGKLEIVPTKYDISSLISDTVLIARINYDSKPIEFLLDVDENTPLNLYGDVMRIKQILGNILSNAYKYTGQGSVKLAVTFETRSSLPDPDDILLIFAVHDTGQGMSEEELDRLFTEYTRFNLEANSAVTGTGLGLSITKRLLDLMGGEIAVESTPGKGSVFTVRIPQKRIGESVCGPEIAERLKNFRHRSAEAIKKSRLLREYMPYGKVLLVDDVKSNIYVTEGLLLPYGIRTDAVYSGADAIKKVKEGNEYDIIFMDHMMPGIDGMETTKRLREDGYTQPIVALTANALVGQAEMFLNSGFDGFITKPIDSRELDTILNRFIRNKKVFAD